LNGVAMTIGAALLGRDALAQSAGPDTTTREYFLEHGITEADPRYYPPALSGMRGSHPGSFEAGHAVRDAHGYHAQKTPTVTGEHYDLIVVGAGISGLSAAYFYKKAKPGARILILDNHDDFGGHAKRNEFTSNGRTLIGYGGTQAIEGPSTYSATAMGLLTELGIDIKRFERYFDQGFSKRHGLHYGVFFDKETFGADVYLAQGKPDWASYVAKTPLSPQAQQDLLRIQTQRIDYLAPLSGEQKIDRLRRISFADFLLKHAKVDPQVVAYFQKMTAGGWAMGIDGVDALTCIQMGMFPDDTSIFGGPTAALGEGLGLPRLPAMDPYIYHFPDGNASIARLLVRRLIPSSAPGRTMEDIVTARFDYRQLDHPDAAVRLRLNSSAVQVGHADVGGKGAPVELVYLRDSKPYRVASDVCILACWNMVIPDICPELPDRQKEALKYGVKVPISYTNVQLRDWESVKKAGLSIAYCPGSFFSEIYMDFPVSMGGYEYTKSPTDPAVLHLVHNPASPGLPAKEQYRAGRLELYSTSFATFEHHIRDQLTRILGPSGFNASTDIQGITVNRWPHGYAYEYPVLWERDWAPDERPNVVGRQRHGNIAIANSDAGGTAETQGAIDEARRAVDELLA
jgi:spermidine dehydrogenase